MQLRLPGLLSVWICIFWLKMKALCFVSWLISRLQMLSLCFCRSSCRILRPVQYNLFIIFKPASSHHSRTASFLLNTFTDTAAPGLYHCCRSHWIAAIGKPFPGLCPGFTWRPQDRGCRKQQYTECIGGYNALCYGNINPRYIIHMIRFRKELLIEIIWEKHPGTKGTEPRGRFSPGLLEVKGFSVAMKNDSHYNSR